MISFEEGTSENTVEFNLNWKGTPVNLWRKQIVGGSSSEKNKHVVKSNKSSIRYR